METTPIRSSDIAFTPAVKDIQSRKGSRRGYARMEEGGSWETTITPELAGFIEKQTSIFIATANGEGQPYIQHRGGPSGFLRVLDEKTIAFVDFAGNRQYITQGNLAENPKAYLFLIDYARRRRIKIWGKARAIEGDADLTARLMPADTKRAPNRSSFSTSQPGTRIARSTYPSDSKRAMSRPRSPKKISASRNWKLS